MKMLILVLIALAAYGCAGNSSSEPIKSFDYSITVETVRGHDYLIYDGFYCGGIVHAAHCPCLTTNGGKP